MARSRALWSALRWSGAPFLMRRVLQRRRVTILCYHDPDPATFSDHVAALGARYTLISLRDYVDARLSGDVSVLPDRALIITLDDGRKGNSRLLDVFREHRLRPTIFLVSGVVGTDRGYWWQHVPGGSTEAERLDAVSGAERVAVLEAGGFSETAELAQPSALSREDVHALSPWVDFQSHTVFHPVLARCSDERARTEIAQSKSDLETAYGLEVYALAYPEGTSADWGRREAGLAERAGYACALSAIPGANDGLTDPYGLQRIVIPDRSSCDELIVRASLLHGYLRKLVPFRGR